MSHSAVTLLVGSKSKDSDLTGKSKPFLQPSPVDRRFIDLSVRFSTFYLSREQSKLTIVSVNGCELPPCYCDVGGNEIAAKEAACKSIVIAIGCVSSNIYST